MFTYTFEGLTRKIDIIIDNMSSTNRDIDRFKSDFKTWLNIEWLSGTIRSEDFDYALEYGYVSIDDWFNEIS
ncbi:MAG: hypothetical protein J6S67_18165 [Methanobrevibacter sp.]|nr:hypothetical protein [Methanobrevibacter sp.]